MSLNNIAVIGHTGMVGSQVYDYYKSKKHETLGFSVDSKKGYPNSSIAKINENSNIIFTCLPTPFDFEKDSASFSVLENVLEKIIDKKIVVIKSTVWPGYTQKLQLKFPRLILLFNPEFLSRATARKDFRKPDRQIVGHTSKSKKIAEQVLKLLPKGNYNKVVRSQEAELIKFAHNVNGAMQIMYANHLYEVSSKLNINYEVVREGFTKSEFVGEAVLRYMDIYHHNNKRGYGGACFPKDVSSYIKFCESIGVKAEQIKATRKANRRILSDQNLTEEIAEKKL